MKTNLVVLSGNLGVDILSTAQEALRLAHDDVYTILQFNGIHIYVNGRTAQSIADEYHLRTDSYAGLWEKRQYR